jgi:hypothetical protein
MLLTITCHRLDYEQARDLVRSGAPKDSYLVWNMHRDDADSLTVTFDVEVTKARPKV